MTRSCTSCPPGGEHQPDRGGRLPGAPGGGHAPVVCGGLTVGGGHGHAEHSEYDGAPDQGLHHRQAGGAARPAIQDPGVLQPGRRQQRRPPGIPHRSV